MSNTDATPSGGVLDDYMPEAVFALGSASIVFGVMASQYTPTATYFGVVGLVVCLAAIWTRLGVRSQK
jgi:hypothetical protein